MQAIQFFDFLRKQDKSKATNILVSMFQKQELDVSEFYFWIKNCDFI